jgi:hypothetical protein
MTWVCKSSRLSFVELAGNPHLAAVDGAHRNLKIAQQLGMETIRQDLSIFFRLNNLMSGP